MRDWVFGSSDWQSIALYNDKTYLQHSYYDIIPEGIVFSLPCKVINEGGQGGTLQVIDGLDLKDDMSE